MSVNRSLELNKDKILRFHLPIPADHVKASKPDDCCVWLLNRSYAGQRTDLGFP